jgi:hypothetical protein
VGLANRFVPVVVGHTAVKLAGSVVVVGAEEVVDVVVGEDERRYHPSAPSSASETTARTMREALIRAP